MFFLLLFVFFFTQTVWTGLYLRGVINQAPQDEAWQEIYKIREYDQELRSKVNKLRRQLASLEREAISNGVVAPPVQSSGASSGDGVDNVASAPVNNSL